jgi:hypothetical protein
VSAVRDKLIAAGVRNLKEFGYPDVTAENILSDAIYREFFKSMVNDNFGMGFDADLQALLDELARGETL